MKKLCSIFVVLFLLFSVAPMVVGSANAENVTVYGEYMTDSEGYNYGVKFYVDSDVGAQVYVDPYVVSRENVYGDVVYGQMLLQPYERRVLIGTFTSADRDKAWSVSVAAKWKTVN